MKLHHIHFWRLGAHYFTGEVYRCDHCPRVLLRFAFPTPAKRRKELRVIRPENVDNALRTLDILKPADWVAPEVGHEWLEFR